jgi:hypothetical protein
MKNAEEANEFNELNDPSVDAVVTAAFVSFHYISTGL